MSAEQKNAPGFIYVIGCPQGFYKIGQTKYVDARIKRLAIQLPFPIELVCIFFVTDRHSYERKLHAEFEAKRLNGEWFALNQIDIDHFLKVEVLFSDFQLISILKRFRSEGEFAAAAGVIELWNDLENHVLPLPNEEELEGSVQ